VPASLATLFAPAELLPPRLVPRWLWLRALGLIFLSAFYALAFQIRGLIGADGILPAADYLRQVTRMLPGALRFWEAPSLFWASATDTALMAAVALGVVASLLLVANVWPRAMVAVCTVLFMSCVAVLQDFSSYQSDGMLLEAGFLSFFLAPRGVRPGLGAVDPPSRAALFLVQWEWFRIYFESGVIKLAGGDPTWRNFTAMDEYYQNGPFPTWIGWHVQHLPHWYHAMTVGITLVVELAIVWALFLPRPWRIGCFVVTSALQIGIIATANYAFLNYLVLAEGVLLLDDAVFERIRRLRPFAARWPSDAVPRGRSPGALIIEAIVLTWAFLATLPPLLAPTTGGEDLPRLVTLPMRSLAPLRIANQYGLFASMTPARYEIEFQGSRDGVHWVAYPFRYKPQDVRVPPPIFAPYQPRFDWNLWFASLGPWQQSPWVVLAQSRLLENDASVLSLFRANPFAAAPPTQVRTVLWRYWFTSEATRRATGAWWRRAFVGPFAGTVTRTTDGRITLQPAP
jgi:hypothetical protein